jgi:hypothetical protein
VLDPALPAPSVAISACWRFTRGYEPLCCEKCRDKVLQNSVDRQTERHSPDTEVHSRFLTNRLLQVEPSALREISSALVSSVVINDKILSDAKVDYLYFSNQSIYQFRKSSSKKAFTVF